MKIILSILFVLFMYSFSNAQSVCGGCNGTGISLTPDDDYYDCRSCGGTGEAACLRCNTRQTEICNYCYGNGIVNEETCTNCYGEGRVSCGRCGGSGYEYCTMCNGTGNKDWYYPCTECGGSGRVDCPE